MHDLWIIHNDRPPAAVEVVAAADPESIALWKLVNGGGRWQVPGIRGGWLASLLPSARGRRLFLELPGLLSELEAAGEICVAVVPEEELLGAQQARAAGLGVTSLVQSGTDFPGSVYFTIDLPLEQSAGFVAHNGDAIADWVGRYLAESQQADVLAKLARSRAQERHAFVLIPGFTTAPFAVSELLMRSQPAPPRVAPSLPEVVTHAWVVPMWHDRPGYYWAAEAGWSSIRTPSDPLPDRPGARGPTSRSPEGSSGST
jgi:hypothetical protein